MQPYNRNCQQRFPWRIKACGGTLLLLCCTATALPAAANATPDFGPNVLLIRPDLPAQEMQQKIDHIYALQQHNEFGAQRTAILFLPGTYHVNVPLGYYTEVLGLGASPDAVQITGAVHADASLDNNNATTTFWRAAAGLSVQPTGGTMQWAVSQGAPLRRMHIRGDLVLNQHNGWASGGWMADDRVDGSVNSGTQQQWIARNSAWKQWNGSNWNMVFVGDLHAPRGSWPKPAYTSVATTPVVREKPFLEINGAGQYEVCVPALRHNSAGISWKAGTTPGRRIPLSHFYLAQAGRDTAASINAQLAQGKDLLFTPGIYKLTDAIHVERAGTVVLGLGFATLQPMRGAPALTTADVDGITIAGILVDAGPHLSPVLLQVGPDGSSTRHINNPIVLHDVFFRVGGAGAARAGINLKINSADTIVDHTWIWRADHGRGIGWQSNPSKNGLVVQGSHVTIYGLFVEHHQQYQVLWNGNAGRTYFYQSEIPYDPPNQAAYRSAPNTKGWASYKVADSVIDHAAWGLGIYSVFTNSGVDLGDAIETQTGAHICMRDMITVALGNHGGIDHVVDAVGGSTSIQPRRNPTVQSYPCKR